MRAPSEEYTNFTSEGLISWLAISSHKQNWNDIKAKGATNVNPVKTVRLK